MSATYTQSFPDNNYASKSTQTAHTGHTAHTTYTHPTYVTISVQPVTEQSVPVFQAVQEASVSPLVYFVNNVPHYCYPQQPEILYPVYMPTDMCWMPPDTTGMAQQFSVPNPRFLGEIVEEAVDAVGDVFKNNINKAEQQAVDNVKSCCCGFFKLYKY